MTAPRFYSWDDDGSPGRALTGNLQNRLKQILVPCLVTGYGSKQGAGWTLGHEHPNGFSLINADGNVVNFVSNLPAQAPYPAMDAKSIHIYCAEALGDISQAVIDGAGLCSGTYRKGQAELVNYPRHGIGYAQWSLATYLSSMQWTLVSDDKTFILSCSNGNGAGTPQTHSFTIYCGAAILDSFVSRNFIALGGNVNNFNTVTEMYAFSRGYTSIGDLITGLSQSGAIYAEPYLSSATISPVGVTEVLPARLNFQQPRLVAAGGFAGRLRGVVYDDVLRSVYGWEVALNALGFSDADFTDRGKPVKIGDFSYAFARSNSGNSFLTDNPAFW